MDDVKKGQIALSYLKRKLREESFFRTAMNIQEQIRNSSEDIGIPTKEASELIKELVYELVEEMFPSN